MRSDPYKTRHGTIRADGLDIFYRHAGDPDRPAILLLHGYPTSSHVYRNIIEPLAETAYVVAPDMPGFGFSSAPSTDAYDYTFENLANTIEAFIEALGLERFFLYITDFGAPVGYQLATRRPDRILGLIVQDGNAHEEGLGPDWDAPKVFFAEPTDNNRAKLPDWMNFEGTRNQYIGGLPERLKVLFPPESWHLDTERLERPGNTDIQFELFTDYGSHIARFPAIQAYLRNHRPACLVLWGRHDAFFAVDEIMAYNRDLHAIEIHVFESGHMLLETHHRQCAAHIAHFMHEVETGVFRDSERR
ncbi:alpha/beta hydrolase [Mesorhizobium sp. M4B.F.Ca.ET.089.01.1.1]|uniref:alpha/beta fold hydrolase n=1 Tax=Mesorhizobium sp. M4B.F.Ca.ET.089.01.1.1 TaxID=2496662 RepID=UPI000FE3E3D9|nr:alpha/beta hydrolase [Mesorhizobium sp. M4B.F.Ca.ET.089.01.1.1]RWX67143.1 alpha/beta hydrolase [Mesorhizobium sp. M4B.F.Ca.ET.089.01.1.1]